MENPPAVTIDNVVVTSSIEQGIALAQLERDLQRAVYDPDAFPGLVYRLTDPKATILLFRTGNLVCTGPDSEKMSREAIRTVLSRLADLGIAVPAEPEMDVVNVVGSADLGTGLDLETVALDLGLTRTEYDPEQFPGLVYRLTDPPVVILLFGSGKCVVTGASTAREVTVAVETVWSDLTDRGAG